MQYKIPVVWSMIGTQIVEADSLQEAIELAEDFLPRPKRGEYLEGTLEVDPEFVSCLDNHNH